MNLIKPSFDPTTFTKNRDPLLKHQVGQQLFYEVVLEAYQSGMLSDEHFTVDGTLIEAAASLKSFKHKDGTTPPDDVDPGNPSVDFHREKRSNGTHQSTTDPNARLFKKEKGKEAKLVFIAPCPDGEPEWTLDGLSGHQSYGDSRTRRRAYTPGPSEGTGVPSQNPGWR